VSALLDSRPCSHCGGVVEVISGLCRSCETRHLRPQPGPQSDFLACAADITLFGGGMGGGKTHAMLLDWLRHINTPGANGLLVRNTFTDVEALRLKARDLYSGTAGADKSGNVLSPRSRGGSSSDITWPSGARLSFGYLSDRNVERFRGPEYSWIGIEEATECSIDSITWLTSRNRTTCGARPQMRMTCNPNPDHVFAEWVAPYLHLDKDRSDYGTADRTKSGMVLYMMRHEHTDRFVFGHTREEVARLTGQPAEHAQTFAFIPSLLVDNPALEATGYAAKFANMPRVEREKNRAGNWRIRADIGGMFPMERWGWVDKPLAQIVRRIRGWDRAATRPKPGSENPDFTFSALIEWDVLGRWYVSDVTACREEPPEVDRHMAATAAKDGPSVTQALEIDPGQAGKAESHHTHRVLRSSGRCGPIWTTRPIKNKITRATPVAHELEDGMASPPGGGPEAQTRCFINTANGWLDRPYRDAGTAPATLGALWWSMLNPFFDPSPTKKKDAVDAMATAHACASELGRAVKVEPVADRFRRLI